MRTRSHSEPVSYRSLTDYPPTKRALGRMEPAVGLTLEPHSAGDVIPVLLVDLMVTHSGVFERTEIVIDYKPPTTAEVAALGPASRTG